MDRRLPLSYRWIRAHGIKSLTPWHLIDSNSEAEALRTEYQAEVAESRASIPSDLRMFARRQDCDDVAGFIVDDGQMTGAVVVVHLTWSGKPEPDGWPSLTRFADFESWMTQEVWPTSLEWMSEEELGDLKEE